MLIEHITALTQNRAIRDTKTIPPSTEQSFRAFGIREGKLLKEIEDTPLTCRITAVEGGAVFDLMEGETILFLNLCCFEKSKKDECLEYLRDLCSKITFGSLFTIIEPKEDIFMYTIPIHPFADLDIIVMCGEIELYIFNALYNAQKDGL